MDLSSEACQLTAENAQRNGIHERLKVIQMNLNHGQLVKKNNINIPM